MKRAVSICLIFLFVLCLTACNGSVADSPINSNTTTGTEVPHGSAFTAVATDINPTVQGMFYRNVLGVDMRSTDPAVKAVDEKADALLQAIEEYPDTVKAKEGCKTYYISNDGDDKNDGLTPETARATYLSVKAFLVTGDAVLFRRGDLWRGQMSLVSGVSYGAYGEGIKPRFYGSVDASRYGEGEWKTTEYDNVYMFSRVISDYSGIFFNNGEAYGSPVREIEDINNKKFNVYYKSGKVYLYSPDGNPADLFETIEISEGYTLIVGQQSTPESPTSNVVIQNFSVMFAGLHGIAPGNSKNIDISGCIIGYIGGKNLYLDGVSIGNGIEFWGNVSDILVHNNFMFQIFDEGASNQAVNTDYSVYEGDITYSGNLFEYCTHSISSFIPEKSNANTAAFFEKYTAEFGDIYVTDNISRYCGFGWGFAERRTRQSFEDFKFHSEMHTGVLVFENNIMDRGKKGGIGFNTVPKKELLYLTDNTFLQYDKRRIMYAVNDVLYMGDDTDSFLDKYFGSFSGNNFTLVK